MCLVFLILGYQACLFVQRSTELHIESLRDHPDTVFVYIEKAPENPPEAQAAKPSVRMEQHPAAHEPYVQKVRASTRRVESFPFNPNTASREDLVRLGFSEKQALSIIAYREKGGHFSRPSDFAKSYVVSDSVFRRLEPYIRIPRLDINQADSAAFDALPGIGPYFASKMVSFRERIGGYSSTEQLKDIWNFGEERYDGIADLICCGQQDPTSASCDGSSATHRQSRQP